MIGVIELDAIAVDKTEYHVRTEGEEFQQKLANFGSLFTLTLRQGRRVCHRIDLGIHPTRSRCDAWSLFLPLRGGFRVSFPLPGVF